MYGLLKPMLHVELVFIQSSPAPLCNKDLYEVVCFHFSIIFYNDSLVGHQTYNFPGPWSVAGFRIVGRRGQLLCGYCTIAVVIVPACKGSLRLMTSVTALLYDPWLTRMVIIPSLDNNIRLFPI